MNSEQPASRSSAPLDSVPGQMPSSSVSDPSDPTTFWPARTGARALLALALVAYAAQSALFWDWYVDDAAISFSFVRNFGAGEGLVLTPGAERVEAYSNPLWVFLLAPFSAGPLSSVVGLPFFMAKLWSLLLGWAALIGLEKLGRRMLPAAKLPVPALAALLTALHPPFLAWTQGGLEGPLYIAGILWGLERLLAELEQLTQQPSRALEAPPWSALLLWGVALTRPEGIMFVLLGAGLRGLHLLMAGKAVRATGGKALFRWSVTFLVPWGLYQLWHYAYFQTWVTNTYYVKKPSAPLLERLVFPSSDGWLYFRSWVQEYWLYLLAGLAVLPVLEKEPEHLERWLARLGLALAGGASLFFALYAGGDWMFTWRFMMPLAPPVFLLGCVGLYRLLERLPAGLWASSPGRPSLASLLFALPLLLLLWPALEGLQAFYRTPTTSVADVKARADYFQEAREKLGLEGDVVYLDPDLGATSYYSGMRVVDTWGLGDVAFARHGTNAAFPIEYILEEVRPDFAHIFGYWNNQTHLLDDPRWGGYYLALPPYRMRNGALDGGNWVRREHLRASRRDYPDVPTPMRVYASALELVHATLEPRAVRPGQTSILTLVWRLGRPNPPEQLVQSHLRGPDGTLVRADHSFLYGWLPPSRWLQGEVLKERIPILVPEGSPEGRYGLEVSLLETSTGRIDPGLSPEGAALIPFLQVGEQAVAAELESLIRTTEGLQQAGHLEEAVKQAQQAVTLAPDSPKVLALLDAAQALWRDHVLDEAETLLKADTARQAAETFTPLYWAQRSDAVVIDAGRRMGAQALERAEQACAEGKLSKCFDDALGAIRLDPTAARARQLAESVRMRRGFAELPPETVDDVGWIQSIVLGTSQDAQAMDSRESFKPGEPVQARIFWTRLDNHRTEWRWYDPQGVLQFQQWQTTTQGAGSSFAFISPKTHGTWTLEIQVNATRVAVRRFEVAE